MMPKGVFIAFAIVVDRGGLVFIAIVLSSGSSGVVIIIVLVAIVTTIIDVGTTVAHVIDVVV